MAACAACSPSIGHADQLDRTWIERSDASTRLLLEAQGRFEPEKVSRLGVASFDGYATDLGPDLEARRTVVMKDVATELGRRHALERDAGVRQDLDILVEAIGRDLEGMRLQRRYFAAWTDVPASVFEGVKGLLDDQVAKERRPRALELLRRYVGDLPGSTPLTKQAKDRFGETRLPGRLGPERGSVERAIANADTFVSGVEQLFAQYRIGGADSALVKLKVQIADYARWERDVVLPLSSAQWRLPPDVYAFRLKERGIDIPPEALIRQAQVEYAETRAAMVALAPLVARKKGWRQSDYRQVIRLLKRDVVPNDRIEASYAEVIASNEAVIRREGIVDLPNRPMQMKLATAAESAAQPAPHMLPPPMVGNKGEHGVFVLPVGVAGDDPQAAYDDFNSRAVEWTVAAHEGRPGHELQFSAMAERGVSQARSLYAFNSVNVEGWALYAEAEALPYHPLEGQLMALQARLLRAARAMLDPMLNLGLMPIEDARRMLLDDVVQSPAMARQEIERYTSRMPGQAGSYFYGYSRLLQLRVEAETKLGQRFDRLAFNNFVIGEGLLPPDLLAEWIRSNFIPAQLRAPARRQ